MLISLFSSGGKHVGINSTINESIHGILDYFNPLVHHTFPHQNIALFDDFWLYTYCPDIIYIGSNWQLVLKY